MIIVIYCCAVYCIIGNVLASSDIVPPDIQACPVELTIHGDMRIDEYYWLRDIDNPDVLTYLEEENSYTEKMLAHTEALREKLYSEILARIPQEDESVPYFRNGYYYYTVFEQDSEYPLYMRKEGSLESPDEMLLDMNLLAEGYSYFQIEDISISPDNNIMAFSVDTMGNHQCTILFKNLAAGEMLDDRVLNASGEVAWANDSRTFFFGHIDATNRTDRIMRRELGSTDEELVHFEEDPMFWPWVYRSISGDFILLGTSSRESSEVWFLETDNPSGDFTIIQPRTENLKYSVYPSQKQFYILTNLEAENYRLMTSDIESPSIDNWVEVIPHRQDVLLEGLDIFSRFMVLSERNNGLTMLRVIEFADNSDHYVDFGEETYLAYTYNNYEFDTDMLRFEYTSMITPWSTFDYNMETHNSILLKQREIPSGYDAALYNSERLWAPAGDGTFIPISMVYRRDIFHPGENPLLLYGYGSYGSSLDPEFSFLRLSLLDRGFVYAIAHVRGGQEMGRKWYDGGKLLNKMNTFTDFIDCAEFLINEGYCNEDLLFAMGESAGGLLMGAVVNMRPDLWHGVVAGVPFVDVVTTMLDETIPLTTNEYEEWGNPNDPVYYEYMLGYSPYDNVRETDYPAMLVYTGLHDSRVGYWEPAKWVARLRDMKTDDNPLLLYTDMGSGHEGSSGRFQWIDRITWIYAFILDQAGSGAGSGFNLTL